MSPDAARPCEDLLLAALGEIVDLEEEVRHLKAELAGRAQGKPVRTTAGGVAMEDYLASLAPQDAAFMRKRLGGKS